MIEQPNKKSGNKKSTTDRFELGIIRLEYLALYQLSYGSSLECCIISIDLLSHNRMRPYVVESSAYNWSISTGHAAVDVVNSGSASTDTGHFAVSQCQLNELPVVACRQWQ